MEHFVDAGNVNMSWLENCLGNFRKCHMVMMELVNFG